MIAKRLKQLAPRVKAAIYLVLSQSTGLARDLIVGTRGWHLFGIRIFMVVANYYILDEYEHRMQARFGPTGERSLKQAIGALFFLLPVYILPTGLIYFVLGHTPLEAVTAMAIDILGAVAIWTSDMFNLLERIREWPLFRVFMKKQEVEENEPRPKEEVVDA